MDFEQEEEGLNEDAQRGIDEIMQKIKLDYGITPDMSTEKLLVIARHILLDKLIMLCATDMATPADRNVLRQLLKDNGMILGDPLSDPKTEEGKSSSTVKRAELPTFSTPEWHN